MDVYLFIRTDPGLAGFVMEGLVGAGAVSRAAVVTGDFDVFARVDDTSWDELSDRVLGGVHRFPGVQRTTTAVIAEGDERGFWFPTVPLWGVPPPSEQRIALCFLTLDAGATDDDLYAISESKGTIGFALVTGEYDAIAQISGRDFKQIQSRVMSLRRIPGVRSTKTMLVVASTPHLGAKGRGGKARGGKSRSRTTRATARVRNTRGAKKGRRR